MNSKLAFAFAISTFALAGAAQAQPPAPQWYPAPYLAHVSIQAPPSTELEVVPAGAAEGSPAVARCTEYCDFWALPGRYTLYTRGHGDDESKQLSLRIKQSSRFLLDPGDEEGRTTGLAVATVGSVALIAGMGMMLAALVANSESDGEPSRGAGSTGIAGILTFTAGMVVTPIGWVMYANNRTHLQRIDNRGYGSLERAKQVRVGVVGVGLGGFGLGGVASF
jgi:hypothetical protein